MTSSQQTHWLLTTLGNGLDKPLPASFRSRRRSQKRMSATYIIQTCSHRFKPIHWILARDGQYIPDLYPPHRSPLTSHQVFLNNKKLAWYELSAPTYTLPSSLRNQSEPCIKGHRSSGCHHTQRPLFEVRKKGRPLTQCVPCQESRRSKRAYGKCTCGDRDEPQVRLLAVNSRRELARALVSINCTELSCR